jgi:hypothetical protein
MSKASVPNGVILYRGPSLLDGRPVVCVATGLRAGSQNAKTGEMIQTYILSDEGLSPVQAILAGRDTSVCGDCPMRAIYDPETGAYRKAGACYVNVGQGAGAVYDALRRGAYPTYYGRRHRALLAGRPVRFGTYGDPAAVPVRVWRHLARLASGRTGYTHQWRSCDQELRRWCMASVETEEQAREAHRAGWRTFRVRLASEPVMPEEIVCPASAEAGRRRTCAECKACSGARDSAKARSVVIIAHGLDWKVARYAEARQREEGRRVALSLV